MMFSTSFPVGRFFGVDLRLHASLPALLVLALLYSRATTGSVLRGFGLCLALLLGIVIREAVRALAAAYNGLTLRALLVFPVGGIMAFTSANAEALESSTRLVTIVAPIANIAAGLLFLGISYGVAPQIQLFAQPWISAEHVLRSLIWTQFALGAVSLMPVATLTSRSISIPRSSRKDGETKESRATPSHPIPFLNFGTALAVALLTAGFVALNIWLFLIGGLVLLATMLRPMPLAAAAAGNTTVRQAMQSDFMLLSSSDTLRSALERSITSPQEVFPIVRGDRLVGSVSRDTLTSHLQAEGDGYLQGVMTRTLPLAFADEPLAPALRRSTSAASGELIAVVDNTRLVGVLTQQGVLRAMQRNAALQPLREEPED